MSEVFGIASFRSRQQVLAFERALRREGVRSETVTTPRDVSVGCGLSVKFAAEDYPRARAVYERARPGNLIGFFRVERRGGERPLVTPF